MRTSRRHRSLNAPARVVVRLTIADPNYHVALFRNHQKIIEQKNAADYDYIQTVAQKIQVKRRTPASE